MMNTKIINIAYFGSPRFSADIVQQLTTCTDLPIKINLICTQPDKPVGRKKFLTPTPVKMHAQEHSIPCVEHVPQPDDLKKHSIDLCIVYAYGKIIPADLLNTLPGCFWNIHPSLLPHYRGPSPVSYPILLGDTKTGVSLMQMDDKVDHGPILMQKELRIDPHENHFVLLDRLTSVAYSMIHTLLGNLDSLPKGTPQDHNHATFTKLLTKNDGYIEPELLVAAQAGQRIRFSELPTLIQSFYGQSKTSSQFHDSRLYNSSEILYNMHKGLYKWPGIWTLCNIRGNTKRTMISEISYNNSRVQIEKIQIEGKKPAPFHQIRSDYSLPF